MVLKTVSTLGATGGGGGGNVSSVTASTPVISSGGTAPNISFIAPGTTGNVLTSIGGAWVSNAAVGGSGSPGGSTTQIQYNNAGAFAGDANLTFSGSTLTSANLIVSNLTASQAVFSSSTKQLVSNPITGTGSVVMNSSPIITSPSLITPALGSPTSGNMSATTNIPVANATGTLVVGNGGTGLTTIPSGSFIVGNSTSAVYGSSNLTTDGANVTVGSANTLRFANLTSTRYVGFKANAIVAANVTWTLPVTDGTAGQVLSTDGSGNLNWTSTLPTPTLSIQYLVVAGGGSGGRDNTTGLGGGGGAGGYKTATGYSATVGSFYTVTVGAGGAAIPAGTYSRGNNGSNSVFDTITSTGGGGGAAQTSGAGNSGGSGGGGDGSAAAGAGSSGQGNNGGAGFAGGGLSIASGGGGGAGAVGGAASSGTGGTGGAGSTSAITGSTYSGGGGGSAYTTLGAGGSGGGGNGSLYNISAGVAGTPNTGGGGGGGWNGAAGPSGAGGSGVVILKYPDLYTITIGAGLTGTTGAASGGFKTTTITDGTGNVSWA